MCTSTDRSPNATGCSLLPLPAPTRGESDAWRRLPCAVRGRPGWTRSARPPWSLWLGSSPDSTGRSLFVPPRLAPLWKWSWRGKRRSLHPPPSHRIVSKSQDSSVHTRRPRAAHFPQTPMSQQHYLASSCASSSEACGKTSATRRSSFLAPFLSPVPSFCCART